MKLFSSNILDSTSVHLKQIIECVTNCIIFLVQCHAQKLLPCFNLHNNRHDLELITFMKEEVPSIEFSRNTQVCNVGICVLDLLKFGN